MAKKLETATFGTGCFWGIEESFRTVKGVIETEAGYSGGKLKNPSYEDVCSGETGYIEVVKIKFDTSITFYEELVNIFWDIHEPTSIDRQGPDIGEQYRSVIFYHNNKQRETAEKSKKDLERDGFIIATKILPAKEFYRAEEYHQKYLYKRGIKVCHS
ncbi:peptide-methionine (S)-S-oxide reductase MsrA [Candidatus Woesearchaeota archaeon]|nr:peptide-methionine (S)-S-oxide reductase MsrA [Candidatus Woesearchaeota archaeon]